MRHNNQSETYSFPIVGIGTSAGGLAALESFFRNVPLDSGYAFVVVQHLSSEFKSLMDKLLARHTDMPINIIKHGMKIEPNQIYLIPPSTFLALQNNIFFLTEFTASKNTLRYPIDHFFQSLAENVKDKAVAVVLSGGGNDGSKGIVDIHHAGGFVLVQNMEDARFDSMPEAAIRTNIVDAVVDSAQMYDTIRVLLAGETTPTQEAREAIVTEIVTAENAVMHILNLLRKRFKVDFNQYKMETLVRRTERRMQILNIEDVTDYVTLLRENPNELSHLYRDVLVDVTHFFRDADAFKWLEEVGLPRLLAKKHDGDVVRVWVAGCATGEEAYSLASLIDYTIKAQKRNLELKVFATDLHHDSIRKAMLGNFDEERAADIPEHMMKSYFFKENGRLYVESTLRPKIIFAPHDLLRDSPFTNLDMITCRNVLIYMTPSAQQRVLNQFQFGLRKDGLLFLGPSEHLGALDNEFIPLNRIWRIFAKKSGRQIFDISTINLTRNNTRSTNVPSTFDASSDGWAEPLLNYFVTDSIIIDSRWNLIRTFGNGVRYLTLPTGRVDLLVTRLVLPDLVSPLRAALYRAEREKTTISLSNILVEVKEDQITVEIKVMPFADARGQDGRAEDDPLDTDYFLIIITPMGSDLQPSTPRLGRPEIPVEIDELEYIEELESELTFLRESLQATVEELETTNEELQSSNEELLASNEELQSTNEELHSVNEELYTINSEYILQNEQLVQLHEQFQSLQRSAQIISIFLDKNQKIREFSAEAGTLFGLMEHDAGRPFANLQLFEHVPNNLLRRLVENAFGGDESSLHIVHNKVPYLLQILPHIAEKTMRVEGAILKLMDLRDLLEGETIALSANLGFNEIHQLTPVLLFIYDVQGQSVVFANWASEPILGVKPSHFQLLEAGDLLKRYFHADDREMFLSTIVSLDELPNGSVAKDRFRMRHKSGEWRWLDAKQVAFARDGNGRLTQMIISATDITETMQNAQRVKELEEQLAAIKSKE